MINVKVLDTLYGKYSRWSQLFICAIIYIHALIMTDVSKQIITSGEMPLIALEDHSYMLGARIAMEND